MSQQLRERDLMRKKYERCTMIDSKEFEDTAYEIKGRAIKVMIYTDNGITQFAASMVDMRLFAREIQDIISVYGDM